MNHLFDAPRRTGSRPHHAAGSRSSRARRCLTLVMTVGLLATGCGPQTPPSDDAGTVTIIEPDGTFTGTTCAAVGHEFGKQLNDQVMATIEANRATPGNASDAISTAVIRLAQGANARLRELNITDACDVPEFLSAADEDLTPELRATVGDFATTPVVSWDVWHQYVRGQLTIIDPEESPPA
jgi:hypothetical protein